MLCYFVISFIDDLYGNLIGCQFCFMLENTFRSEVDPSHFLCQLKLRSNQPHNGKKNTTRDHGVNIGWKLRIKQAAGAFYRKAFRCYLQWNRKPRCFLLLIIVSKCYHNLKAHVINATRTVERCLINLKPSLIFFKRNEGIDTA